MRIAVVGTGYVGLVVGACLADSGNHVACIDSDQEKIDRLKRGEIPIYEPGLGEIIRRNESAGRLTFSTDLRDGVLRSLIVFIGVGTPGRDDGSAETGAVLSVAGEVADAMDGYRLIATKSTVPVGTHRAVSDVIRSRTEHPFDYVSNPEFLKEGAAVQDFMKPERVIVGCESEKAIALMRQLYSPYVRKRDRLIFMDPASAEMTKYAANCMLATRISFMNELTALCERVGADIEHIRSGIGSDSRIGNAFLFPGVGFGGSCFPKDLRALIHVGDQNGCDLSVIRSAWDANIRQQERFAGRVIDYFGGGAAGEKTLAVWGLAFKARTDDIRESPAIHCIERFLDAGMEVRAFDPQAGQAARDHFAARVDVSDDNYGILEGADGLVVLTDWQEFRNPDFQAIGTLLRTPVVFDGRNLYDPIFMATQGIEYHCVGRPGH
jgi:UDPglucose 6-dehydrogenase